MKDLTKYGIFDEISFMATKTAMTLPGIIMGAGNVAITTSLLDDEGHAGVFFSETAPEDAEVGVTLESPTAIDKLNPSPEWVIMFDNADSIDVLISALEEVREELSHTIEEEEEELPSMGQEEIIRDMHQLPSCMASHNQEEWARAVVGQTISYIKRLDAKLNQVARDKYSAIGSLVTLDIQTDGIKNDLFHSTMENTQFRKELMNQGNALQGYTQDNNKLQLMIDHHESQAEEMDNTIASLLTENGRLEKEVAQMRDTVGGGTAQWSYTKLLELHSNQVRAIVSMREEARNAAITETNLRQTNGELERRVDNQADSLRIYQTEEKEYISKIEGFELCRDALKKQNENQAETIDILCKRDLERAKEKHVFIGAVNYMANRVQAIGFAMKAPNAYTPKLNEAAILIRQSTAAYRSKS